MTPRFVPGGGTDREGTPRLKVELAIAQWNAAWEADHLRPDLFADELPPELSWIRPLHGREHRLGARGGLPEPLRRVRTALPPAAAPHVAAVRVARYSARAVARDGVAALA